MARGSMWVVVSYCPRIALILCLWRAGGRGEEGKEGGREGGRKEGGNREGGGTEGRREGGTEGGRKGWCHVESAPNQQLVTYRSLLKDQM